MKSDKENYIVIATTAPFPFGHASDNAIFTFLDGFQEHGCKGEVLCIYPNSPSRYSDVKPSGSFQGVSYSYLPGYTTMPASKSKHYLDYFITPFFRFKKYLKEKSSQYNVTILMVAEVENRFWLFTKICRELGVKVVLVACEYPAFLKKRNAFREWEFRLFSRNIDKYIYETKTLENYSKEVLQKELNSIVVPATMPFNDILECKRQPSDEYVAYCGSIQYEHKDGLKNIIKAYSEFHKQHPNVLLKMIGRVLNQQYFQELQQLSKQLGIENKVVFTGEVSRQDLIQYLSNAELMIVAKPLGSYYGGGLSSKVIEYLFSGNPVLMVAADDYVNYLTDNENVFFVKDNEPDTLADALRHIFSSDDKRRRVGMAGQNYAMEHFNYHILTKDLLSFVLS